MASPILVQPDVAQRQPHLELLPAEVFEMVAEVADEKDLLALRLTSRQCASKILKTYTKVHFTEVGSLFRYNIKKVRLTEGRTDLIQASRPRQPDEVLPHLRASSLSPCRANHHDIDRSLRSQGGQCLPSHA